MPNSTLLPTPEPANRPRRWPRPTVSRALMARTPVSSGSRTRARAIEFSGWRSSASMSTWVIGPRWSSGLPCESTTRPSRPRPSGRRRAPRSLGEGGLLIWPTRGTGRYGASGVTVAPLDRPCVSPAGMRKARSLEKPTTSASTGSRAPLPIRHCEPTGTFRPTASSTRPARRVSVPRTSSGVCTLALLRTSSMKWPQRLSAPSVLSDIGILRVPGAAQAQVGDGAQPAFFDGGVHAGAGRLDQAAARADVVVGHEIGCGRTEVLQQRAFHEREVARVHAHRGGQAVVDQLRQRLGDHGSEVLGVALQLLAHHLAREVAGEFQNVARDLFFAFLQVLFGVVQQLGHAHRGFFGGLAHGGFQRVAHFLATGGVAQRITFGMGPFADFVQGLGGRAVDHGLAGLRHHGRGVFAAVHGREAPGRAAVDLLPRNETGVSAGFRRSLHRRLLPARSGLRPTGAARPSGFPSAGLPLRTDAPGRAIRGPRADLRRRAWTCWRRPVRAVPRWRP